jgi:D-alanine--poly(phosphoribitol) ligase subunit 2
LRPEKERFLSENTIELIYAAVDELNAQSGEQIIEKNPDAPLLGSDKGIDSLTFINLIVAVEEQINQRTGKSIILVDEDYMAEEKHPFRTLGTLTDYVGRVMAARAASD